MVQIQPEWQLVVDAAKEKVRAELTAARVPDTAVVGLYLRGSVAQGTAVAHLSDVDLSLYLLDSSSPDRSLTQPWSTEEVQRRLSDCREALTERFSICSKIGAPAYCMLVAQLC